MKFLNFITCMLLYPFLLQANHNYNKIVIPSVTIDNPYWEFAYQPIAQSYDGAFENLIEKWENIIKVQWQIVNEKMYDEVGISANRLTYYLSSSVFLDFYMNCYRSWYPEFFDEATPQEIDPIVLNFLHLKFYYLGCNKPIQFNKITNMPMISTSFGADNKRHYLIFNDNFYNQENIKDLYQATADKVIKYQIFPSNNIHPSRIIENSNLLHLGITLSLSNIVHQADLFIRLLPAMTYGQEIMSDKMQKYCSDYMVFLSFIESALQSKNPVEIALYLQPQLDNLHFTFSTLWEEFIHDLQNCYDPCDLKKYELFSQEERRAALYENHSNE